MKVVKVNTIAPKKERNEINNDLEKLFRLCGANTGNVVFFDLLDKEIAFDETISIKNLIFNKEKEKVRYIFPAANWISMDSNVLKTIFLPLEDRDAECVVIGLGLQLADVETQSLKDFFGGMSEDTKKALKIMSEHSVSIGVRGSMTAECLEKLGIHNVDVIGCPSFYSDGILEEKRKNKKLCDPDMGEVCFNITPGSENNEKLLALGMKNYCYYMLQTRMEFPQYIEERMMDRGKEDKVVYSYYKRDDVNIDLVQGYIKERGIFCKNIDEWEAEYLQNKISFTFGNRFHGNMMSYLLGVPALWIEHDVRTKELIELFRLPHIKANELESIRGLEELKEKCIYSDEFWKNRKSMFEKYKQFLDKNRLLHNFE